MLCKLLILLIALFVTACSTLQSGVKERFVWPPPPDTARIEWLKTYSSQLDIEKTSIQEFWAAIAGDDPPNRLLKPIEVKSVPEWNKFFVSDVSRGAVLVFDLNKHELRAMEIPEEAPPLRLPLSIAVDRDGLIYVLERRSASILVFSSSEKYLKTISLKSISVSSPNAMIIDRKNALIYISDAASRKIVVTDLQGILLRSVGGPGEDDGQFNLPVSMALNSKGHLIVGDTFGAKVQVFDATGRYMTKFGRRGDSAGDFQLIKSLAVDSSDNIYVVDGRSHNIRVFNEQGELLLILGGFYASAETGKLAPGGFSVPIGIDIDSKDRIYVVDQMNARVQVFQYYSEDYLPKVVSQ